MAAVLKCNESYPTQQLRRATVIDRAPRIDPPDLRTAQLFAELLMARWLAPMDFPFTSPPPDFEPAPDEPAKECDALPSFRAPRDRSEFG